jgi:hypothetical protein
MLSRVSAVTLAAQVMVLYCFPLCQPAMGGHSANWERQTRSGKTQRPRVRTAHKTESPKEEVLTNDSIIQLLKARIDEDLIIAKIQRTEHSFNTSADALIALKQAGASKRLILFIMDPSKLPPAIAAEEPDKPKPTSDPASNHAAGAATSVTAKQSDSPNPVAEPPAPGGAGTTQPERASGSDEFKNLIQQRYKDKVLFVMVNGMYAGETGKGFLSSAYDTKLQYYHYHSSVPIPNRKRFNPLKLWGRKTNEMDRVDDRTFGDIENLQAVPLQRGDPLKVDRIEILSDRIEFNLISTRLRTIRDIDINKSSKEADVTVRGGEARTTVHIPSLGFRFKFFFDKTILKSGDYRTVVAEISKYLLPEQEAKPVLQSEKNVQVDQGMREEDVITRLGQPLRTISFGETKTLIYREVKVVLKNGKVVEVKID